MNRFRVADGNRIWDSVNAGFRSTEFLGAVQDLEITVLEMNNRIECQVRKSPDRPVLLNGEEYRERRAVIESRIARANVREWPF